MKTLLTGYRVRDIERSLAFYTRLGSREVGRVSVSEGTTLVMLCLPDDDMVTIELVHVRGGGACGPGTGFSHIAIQVENLDTLREYLAAGGIAVEPVQWPAGERGPRTSFVHDPDGYRFELVQWPAGHAPGMTEADFA